MKEDDLPWRPLKRVKPKEEEEERKAVSKKKHKHSVYLRKCSILSIVVVVSIRLLQH